MTFSMKQYLKFLYARLKKLDVLWNSVGVCLSVLLSTIGLIEGSGYFIDVKVLCLGWLMHLN